MKTYLELTKPRITVMVVATAALAYWLAGGWGGLHLAVTLLAVACSSASAGVLNQYMERDVDGLMERTKRRPLPSGRIQPRQALQFGLLLAVTGLGLGAAVNLGVAALIAGTLAFYLLAYTPLKRVTPQSTWMGAIAGATPPLIGWMAATGTLHPLAWFLFAIQVVWQIPHFLALFWMHRADYARAGFRVMPVVDPRGGSTAAQIAMHSFALLPASLMPGIYGSAGLPYSAGALVLSTAYLGVGMRASWTLAPADTRRLFLFSLAYLPILFGMLVWGGV